MEPIPLYVFLMVLAAASLHAIWNFFARKVKGNLAVIFLSLWVGALVWLPPTIVLYFRPLYSTSTFPLTDWKAFVVSLATGLIHTVYFIFLGISYRHGEISVVYPIARGTGVGLTGIVAAVFLGEWVGVLGVVGIVAIVFGILAIGLKPEMFSCFRKQNKHVELKEMAMDITDELTVSSMDDLDEETDSANPEVLDETEDEKAEEEVEPPELELTKAISTQNKNNMTSLACAFVVGVSICMYSTIDKIGVSIVDVDPITYAFFLAFFAALGMTPYMLWKYKPECVDAMKNLKPYVASVGPLTLLSYTMILFAYRAADVSLVVAEREVSVVIGAILGFTLLKEKVTWQKIVGIACILTGLVLVKLSG